MVALGDLAATGARPRARAHARTYVLVNLFLQVIWLLLDRGGFYWPAIPLLLWGIGLLFEIWDAYWPDVRTEGATSADARAQAPR